MSRRGSEEGSQDEELAVFPSPTNQGDGRRSSSPRDLISSAQGAGGGSGVQTKRKLTDSEMDAIIQGSGYAASFKKHDDGEMVVIHKDSQHLLRQSPVGENGVSEPKSHWFFDKIFGNKKEPPDNTAVSYAAEISPDLTTSDLVQIISLLESGDENAKKQGTQEQIDGLIEIVRNKLEICGFSEDQLRGNSQSAQRGDEKNNPGLSSDDNPREALLTSLRVCSNYLATSQTESRDDRDERRVTDNGKDADAREDSIWHVTCALYKAILDYQKLQQEEVQQKPSSLCCSSFSEKLAECFRPLGVVAGDLKQRIVSKFSGGKSEETSDGRS